MRPFAQTKFATRAIPQEQLERVAEAAVEMVALSRRLLELSERIAAQAPGPAEALKAEVSRLLDLADAVSGAARTAADTR